MQVSPTVFLRMDNNLDGCDFPYEQDNLRFDPNNPLHKEKLSKWCHHHWKSTFLKSLQSGNNMFYHDCCSSFSRRCFSKTAGHPPLQSCAVTRIPSFKEVSSSADFFKWLFKQLDHNTKRGQRCLFPAINRPHIICQEIDVEKLEEEIQTLRKRVVNLESSEEKLNMTINSLKDENDRLMKSTKKWYLKYQDLLEGQDKQVMSTFTTPLKKQSNLNFGFLDELI